MKSIETTAKVTEDGMLTLPAPSGTPPGEHSVVVVLDDRGPISAKRVDRELPVLHCGRWPENLSLRREDLYGDSER